MRRPLVVGNWKMNGLRETNHALLTDITTLSTAMTSSELAICTPFVYLHQSAQLLSGSQIGLGAQDVSTHLSGAYTGEVSAQMLSDNQCKFAIVGHSERRQYHHESSLLVAQKTMAAIGAGIEPIICVGETLEQREANATLDVIGEQLQAVQSVVGDAIEQCTVAYEPVWAIGTGLTATPEQAQEVHAFIRKQLGSAASKVSILYGGSVKPSNAQSLFAQEDIDGALVGGASLVAQDFIDIAKAF